jgi:DNA polymerase
MLAYPKLKVGFQYSTVLPDFDFETYSEAGYKWDEKTNRWESPNGNNVKGLSCVGVVKYSEHPSTEVLCMSYNLKNGNGAKLWTPNDPPPQDLFDHLNTGGIIEAWNCAFEFWIWNNVCTKKYKWPTLLRWQLRDAMAKSRAFGLPGKLANAGEVLNTTFKKDASGTRLLSRFSVPQNPTIKNPVKRIFLKSDPEGTEALYKYNLRDIEAEAEISSQVPDLCGSEFEFWLFDQLINERGVQLDIENVENCIYIIEEAYRRYNLELSKITNGAVNAVTELPKIKKWCESWGFTFKSLDEEAINSALSREDVPENIKNVFKIRLFLGSSAVKKLYAMRNQVSSKNRLHELFIYHSARTGRAAGGGVQPQNMPNSGLEVALCQYCWRHYKRPDIEHLCPFCLKNNSPVKKHEWNAKAVEDVLNIVRTRSLDLLELYYTNPIDAIYGCLRGLFIAAPGYDLICSDYSAIEAVVLAALAKEDWRLEVFRTHGKIYEMSASKITGIAFEEFEKYYKENNKQHHPMRKKIGKVAELASGYQGWIGAWKQFGADEFFNDEEIKQAILAWRKASPKIVEFWGGQFKYGTPNLHGLEGAAIKSVMLNNGEKISYNGISYFVDNDILYCELLSGRYITYHKPRLEPADYGRKGYQLTYETWNTNPKYGSIGWVRIPTYGGKLTENVVQATARDILAHAIINLHKSGYPVVLHIHDEIVSEIPENFGSLEEFESIMSTLPAWASNWPIRAAKGWRGKRYR